MAWRIQRPGCQAFLAMSFAAMLFALLPAESARAENELLQIFDEFEAGEDPHQWGAKPSTEGDSIFRFCGEVLRVSGELSVLISYSPAIAHGRGNDGKKYGSHLKTGLKLDADMRPAGAWRAHFGLRALHDTAFVIHGRDRYDDQHRNVCETELEMHETYFQTSMTHGLDIKIGRQIVPWGTSESMRVVDILNPMDRREPGMTDIEDQRLPVLMTKLDYHFGTRWTLTGVVVNETRFDKNPVRGSEFYLTAHPSGNNEPEFSMENQGLALAMTGRFTGWDMTLNAAWILDDSVYYVDNTQKHARVVMLGGTGQAAMGNWLLKGEGAVFTGKRYSVDPNTEYCRADLLVGAEYKGFKETAITIELLNRHIMGLEREVAERSDTLRRDDSALGVRMERNFRNDTLHLLALASLSLPLGQGGLGRAEISYDLNDNLTLRGGYAFYLGGKNPTYKFWEGNDRIFTELQYRF